MEGGSGTGENLEWNEDLVNIVFQSFVGIISLCGDLPSLEVWIVDLDAEPVVCFTGDVNHKWSDVGSVRQILLIFNKLLSGTGYC